MNMQDMERECCKVAGIKPERLCSLLYGKFEDCMGTKCTPTPRPFKTRTLTQEEVDACPQLRIQPHSTGPELVKKLKTWCVEKHISWYEGHSTEMAEDPSPYYCGLCKWRLDDASGEIEPVYLTDGTEEADTEHEAFIKAFHAAFVEEG